MSRLHVCIDLRTFLFSRAMWIGLMASLLLTTGVPSTKKWPVAPKSDTVYSTQSFITFVLKIVSAIESSRRTSFSTNLAHDLALVVGTLVSGIQTCNPYSSVPLACLRVHLSRPGFELATLFHSR